MVFELPNSFNFYDYNMKSDCIFLKNARKHYVYLNLEDLRNILEEEYKIIFKNFPNIMSDIKLELDQYKEMLQNK